MFQHRELGLIQAYQCGATLVVSAVFWGYYLLLGWLIPGFTPASASGYLEFYLFLILTFQISFLRSRHNDVFSVSTGIIESHQFVWPHLLFTAGISGLFLWLTRNTTLSRIFLVTLFPLTYLALLLFTRYTALDLLRFFLGNQRQKLLLVGWPKEIQNVSSLLEKARLFGFETVGMATEAPPEDLPCEIPKLGEPDELEAILDRYDIGNIFILGSPRDRRMLGGWLRLAEARGCRVSLVNDLDLFLQRRLSYFRCDAVDLIELRQEPLQNLVNRITKRAFDIAISLPVVCLVLPWMMLAVWLCQRFQAPGPLFFCQSRSGVDHRRFTIFKFRTMYADRCDSAAQATASDHRIYPIGRVLRRFSLDEFPQFLNVLLGHMSLVGPRPHMPQHDQIFTEVMSNYRVRSFVKPGITGLAQIRGFRGETSSPADIILRVECDIEYIEKWELFLDLQILWRTLRHLVQPPESAY